MERARGRIGMGSLAAMLAIGGAMGASVLAPGEGLASDFFKKREEEEERGKEISGVLDEQSAKQAEYDRVNKHRKKRAYSSRWTMRQGSGGTGKRKAKGPARQPKPRKPGRSHATLRSR